MSNHDIDTTITYPTRKDGSLTKRGQERALADLAVVRDEAVRLRDELIRKAETVGLTEAEGDECNAYHDAVSACDADILRAERNLAPIRTAGGWLAFHNVD